MQAVCEVPAPYVWPKGREPKGALKEWGEANPEAYRRLYHPTREEMEAGCSECEAEQWSEEGLSAMVDHILEHTGWMWDPVSGDSVWLE